MEKKVKLFSSGVGETHEQSCRKQSKCRTLEEWQMGVDKLLPVLLSLSDFESPPLCFLPHKPLAK